MWLTESTTCGHVASVSGCYHRSTDHSVDCEKDGATEADCASDMWLIESTTCGHVASVSGCYHVSTNHSVDCKKDGATEADCPASDMWLTESTTCGYLDPSWVSGCYSPGPPASVTCRKDGAKQEDCPDGAMGAGWRDDLPDCGWVDPDAPAEPCVEGEGCYWIADAHVCDCTVEKANCVGGGGTGGVWTPGCGSCTCPAS